MATSDLIAHIFNNKENKFFSVYIAENGVIVSEKTFSYEYSFCDESAALKRAKRYANSFDVILIEEC